MMFYPMLLRSHLLMDDFPWLDIAECASLFRQIDPCTGIDRDKRGLQHEGRLGEVRSWFGKHRDVAEGARQDHAR